MFLTGLAMTRSLVKIRRFKILVSAMFLTGFAFVLIPEADAKKPKDTNVNNLSNDEFFNLLKNSEPSNKIENEVADEAADENAVQEKNNDQQKDKKNVQQPASITTQKQPATPEPGEKPAVKQAVPAQMESKEPENNKVPATSEVIPPNDFAGVPFVPGSRRIAASGEAPDEYVVQEGDTLYDICDQLLDEPDYWPKLWALNPDIKNPHFLYPSTKLHFYPGDTQNPPFLQIVNEEDIVPVDKANIEEKELIKSESAAKAIAEMTNESPSVVSFSDLAKKEDYLESFDTIGTLYEPNNISVTIPAFIFNDKPRLVGEVVGGSYGGMLVGDDGDVVVELEEQISPGTLVTVLRPSGSIYSSYNGKWLGYRYEFIAQLRIRKPTLDPDYVVGRVVVPRVGVRPDDIVVPYLSTSRDYSTKETANLTSDPGASVVGFEYPLQRVGSQGNLIFLDKPFSPGTTLSVYTQLDKRASTIMRNSLPEVEEAVGVVQVIEKFTTSSLGIVRLNTFDIRIGDTLGPSAQF